MAINKVPGIIHQSIGYEVFKQYQSGVEAQKAFLGGIEGQQSLSTLELSLIPFVPFTEKFEMVHGDLPGNGWAMHPEMGGKASKTLLEDFTTGSDTWEARLGQYNQQDGIQEAIDIAESISLGQQEAYQLSRQLSIILQSAGIAKNFEGGVIGEIQDQAMSQFLRSLAGPQAGAGWQEPGIQRLQTVSENDLARVGGLTFDAYSSDGPMGDMLEHSIHMLHRRADADFAAGIVAMEMTNMTDEKFFTRAIKGTQAGDIATVLEFQTATETAVQERLTEFSGIGRTIQETYDSIPEGTTRASQVRAPAYDSSGIMISPGVAMSTEGGFESHSYFAKQIFARLFEFQNAAFFHNQQPPAAWVFQVPVGTYK